MRKILFILIISLFSSSLKAQTEKITFDVFYKGRSIGNLTATTKKTDKIVIKDLKTNTEVDVIALSIHVESEVKILKKDEKLIQSSSYRHANKGTEEITSNIKKAKGNYYDVKRNGENSKIEHEEINFCTVDLYFAEPLGVEAVFSTMYAEFLKLEEVSPHRYKLSSPKSKDTFYTYKEGQLIMVEIDTRLGMVTCKRVD